MIRCDFCGFEFEPVCETQGCAGCPVARSCTRIQCPRCGYSMLPEAKLVGWVKKIMKKTPLTPTRTVGASPQILQNKNLGGEVKNQEGMLNEN